MEAKAKTGLKISYGYEHRGNICECGHKLEIRKVEIECNSFGKIEKRLVDRPVCECGGKGILISRAVSISPPSPPTCLSIRCLWKFFRESLFYALITSYHSRRVMYAEKNRSKPILERYRTGEPSPQTIWQAIHANIKLKCPVCRKFNKDPLLFSNLYKENK